MWELDEDEIQRQVALAVGGDSSALEFLLLASHDPLRRRIAARIPLSLRALVDPEDILQETYIQAFRDIAHFVPRGPGAFSSWLTAIADHRLLDALRKQCSLKRGAGQTLRTADAGSSADLLNRLAQTAGTPSRIAAGREADAFVAVAIAGLKDEYRQVVQMIDLQRRPVAEVAAALQRSEGAVQKLHQRALDQLKLVLGRSSRFFTKSE